MWVFVAVCGLLAGMCHAAIIVNPSFETGDLTGWAPYGDIDGLDTVSGVTGLS